MTCAQEKTRILTVDDSPSMRALLKHALTAEGFHVDQADDGVCIDKAVVEEGIECAGDDPT